MKPPTELRRVWRPASLRIKSNDCCCRVVTSRITRNEHVINGNRLTGVKANSDSNWFAFPFFCTSLSGFSIDQPLRVSPRMRLASLAVNGLLTAPIPGLMSPNVYFVPVSCRRGSWHNERVGGWAAAASVVGLEKQNLRDRCGSDPPPPPHPGSLSLTVFC